MVVVDTLRNEGRCSIAILRKIGKIAQIAKNVQNPKFFDWHINDLFSDVCSRFCVTKFFHEIQNP